MDKKPRAQGYSSITVQKTDIWICETDNQVSIEDHQGPIAIYNSKARALEVLDEKGVIK